MIRSLMELALAHSHSRKTWDPTQANLGKERRVFERRAVQWPCRMNNPLFGLESDASLTNLSMGGVGVVAPVSWPEGSQVRVSFQSLALDGMVVFRRDPSGGDKACRYGIKFKNLGLLDLFKLRKLIHGGLS